MKMNVAISLNEKFTRYGYVMLSSLFCQHENDEMKVFVLHRELSEQRKDEYKKLADNYRNKEVIFLEVTKEEFSNALPSTEKWPVEIYYRLLLPFLLPKEERILYLDTDIIVREPLYELYELPFDGKLLWGAIDNNDGNLTENQEKLFADIRENNPEFHYINSGVLLMNLNGLRETYQPKDIEELAMKQAQLLFAFDQDLINYLFYDRIGYLNGERYNFFARLYHNSGYTYQDVTEKKVAIVHYSGAKPWSGQNLLTDLDRFWWDEAKKTPYFGELLEERTFEEMEVGYENSHEFFYADYRLKEATREVDRLRKKEEEYLLLIRDSKELIEKLSVQQ